MSNKLTWIAGPCVIESPDHSLSMARALQDLADDLGVDFYFKSSFDKANRTSISSYRGPGMEKGLEILSNVKEETGAKVLSDIHEPHQAEPASRVLDVLQIPALLSRQTDLLVAAAKHGGIVNIKKGQFMSPWDAKHAMAKVTETNPAAKIWVTERGASFGYNNNVVDMRSFPVIADHGAMPIIDATHTTQIPGGQGGSSGGQPQFIPTMAGAGIAAGAGGLFTEVHDAPENALSDGPCMLRLADAESIMTRVLRVWDAVQSG